MASWLVTRKSTTHMTVRSLVILITLLIASGDFASGSQADDTIITISAQTPGVTPFIDQLALVASDTTVLRSVKFTITPKAGSVTRSLSGTYSSDYLISRGYLQPPSEEIFLPVYGLYDGYTNTVTLTYNFLDGSSKQDTTTVPTSIFDDP